MNKEANVEIALSYIKEMFGITNFNSIKHKILIYDNIYLTDPTVFFCIDNLIRIKKYIKLDIDEIKDF